MLNDGNPGTLGNLGAPVPFKRSAQAAKRGKISVGFITCPFPVAGVLVNLNDPPLHRAEVVGYVLYFVRAVGYLGRELVTALGHI